MPDFIEIANDLLGDDAVILDDSEEKLEFIDTGSYSLNAALSASIYGGIIKTKILGLAGEEQTGKTYYALAILKNFLASNKKAVAIVFDTEGGTFKDQFIDRGIDPKRVLLVQPSTVQQFKARALQIVDAYEKTNVEDRIPVMFVLDSLGMLSTSKEMEDSAAGKDTRDMTRPQIIRSAFRTLTLRLKILGIPMIVTNHIYTVIGSYVPMSTMGGGGGLKYAASSIASLRRKKDKDGTGADAKVRGTIITITMTKTRVSREYNKVLTRILYDGGLDRYYGLIPIAEEAGLLKKVSKKFTFPIVVVTYKRKVKDEDVITVEKVFTQEVEAEAAAIKIILDKYPEAKVKSSEQVSAFESDIQAEPEKYFIKPILDGIEKYVNVAFAYGGAKPSSEKELEDEILALQNNKSTKKKKGK